MELRTFDIVLIRCEHMKRSGTFVVVSPTIVHYSFVVYKPLSIMLSSVQFCYYASLNNQSSSVLPSRVTRYIETQGKLECTQLVNISTEVDLAQWAYGNSNYFL